MAKSMEQIFEEQMQAFINMKLNQSQTQGQQEQQNDFDSNSNIDSELNTDSDTYEDSYDEYGDEDEYTFDSFESDNDYEDNTYEDEENTDYTSTSDIQNNKTKHTTGKDGNNESSSNSHESLQSQIIQELLTQVENLKSQVESKYGKVKSESQFYNSETMQNQRKSSYSNIFSNEQPFERIVSEPYTAKFCGNTFKYQRYEEPANFGDKLDLGKSFEDNAKNFRKISKNIVKDIDKMFGGLGRITDVAVVSDILIFNGVSYEPLLPDSYISCLPLDVQNAVKDGQFAWLFDFEELRNMPNLTNLLFDNSDFVFRKVRVDLTARKDFEPKHLYKYFKKLVNLQIGEYIFNRNNLNEYDDVFHKVRRSTEIADAIDAWGVNATKSSWSSVRDCYNNPNRRGIWKALSVVGMTGVAVTATAGTGGFRAGRLATKVGKSLINGISSVIEATKENL